MELMTSHQLAVAQVRFEDAVPRPAWLFTSAGRVFFDCMSSGGVITNRIAAFAFWKKGNGKPDLVDTGGSFPMEPGVVRMSDGAIFLTMMFGGDSFADPLAMVEVLKAGLVEMEAMAGDEWLR